MIHVKDIRYCTPPFSKQPIQSGRLDEHSLYVKNIPKYMDEKAIEKLFSPFGPVGSIKLLSKEQYPCNRAFVNLKSKDSCQAAIDSLNGWKDKQGNTIYVEFKKNFASSRDTNIGHQRKSMSENTPTLCPRPSDGLQGVPRGTQRGSRRSPGNYASDSHSMDKSHSRANSRLGGGQYTSSSSMQNTNCVPSESQTLPSQKGGQCHVCSAQSSMRCSICKVPFYCSVECQKQHWNAAHRVECQSVNSQRSSVTVVALPEATNIAKDIVHRSVSSTSSLANSDTESVCSSMVQPSLPLLQPLKVKLRDFSSPSQFFVELVEDASTAEKLPRVWECSLSDIAVPVEDERWSEEVMAVCSSSGLALGGLCTITASKCHRGVHQCQLQLRNGKFLSEQLVLAGLARKISELKYAVKESLHSKLKVTQNIQVVIEKSSVEGASDFYAQVGGQSLQRYIAEFSQIEPKIDSYGSHIANKQGPDFKAEVGDFVVAPFNGSWYRGQVTTCNEQSAVIAYIDYGNISAVPHSQLIPLPKQFSELPAISVKCQLSGVRDSDDGRSKQMAIHQIQTLADCNVRAVVQSIEKESITIDVYNEQGENVAEKLVSHGYALRVASKHAPPQLGSASTTPKASRSSRSVFNSPEDLPPLQPMSDQECFSDSPKLVSAGNHGQQTFPPASSSRQKPVPALSKVIADTVYHEANLQSETLSVGEQASVVVVNCDDLDEIYVQRADQVAMRRLLLAMEQVTPMLASPPHLDSIHKGELLLTIDPDSGEADRVVVLDTAEYDGMIRVRSIDYGSKCSVRRNSVAKLTPETLSIPKRAIQIRLAGTCRC